MMHIHVHHTPSAMSTEAVTGAMPQTEVRQSSGNTKLYMFTKVQRFQGKPKLGAEDVEDVVAVLRANGEIPLGGDMSHITITAIKSVLLMKKEFAPLLPCVVAVHAAITGVSAPSMPPADEKWMCDMLRDMTTAWAQRYPTNNFKYDQFLTFLCMVRSRESVAMRAFERVARTSKTSAKDMTLFLEMMGAVGHDCTAADVRWWRGGVV